MEISILRQCKRCGKEFFAFRANQQYCSSDCRVSNWQDANAKEPIKHEVVCKNCGNVFLTSDSRKTFCNTECRFAFFNKKRPTTKEKQRECPQCGKSFVPRQKRGVGRLYCSAICKRKYNYKKNYKSIKTRQAAWHKKNKWGGAWEDALKRDKYTCQLCKKQLYPSRWLKGNGLAVHHKDGSGETENKNHELDNLTTLCTDCHREFHTKVNVVQINGKYYVRGRIFELLGIKQIETLS